jgi:16S rRNA (guanine527-N7)-methyltransferase
VFHVKSKVLAGLAERYSLTPHQQGQLRAVLNELVRDDRAPTSVREPEQAVDVHLADSLVALELDALRAVERIADVGAGAGFPGLALAVALPRVEVRLIESQARKCAFMEGVCDAAQIANASIVCTRAEEWGAGVGHNDVVLARALAPAPVVLEYAAPLLRIGGTLVDWRGQRDDAAESAAAVAAGELRMRLVEIRRVEPYVGVRDHHLHIYVKQFQTPARFPRRAGMARKRPLGGKTALRADPDRR